MIEQRWPQLRRHLPLAVLRLRQQCVLSGCDSLTLAVQLQAQCSQGAAQLIVQLPRQRSTLMFLLLLPMGHGLIVLTHNCDSTTLTTDSRMRRHSERFFHAT